MQIDRQEVLRYLGHRGQELDERLVAVIDRAIADCLELARPQTVHLEFGLDKASGAFQLAGTGVALTGASITQYLDGADRCVLLAATLGVEVETRIRALERTDITASLALDAAATTAIEAVCDDCSERIRAEAAARGLYAGQRFSPGYGDLPLDLQPQILQLLNAMRRIGLTCTGSLILLPRKSVTAITGLFPEPKAQPRAGCAGCALRSTCDFRRCAAPQAPAPQ